MYKMHNSKNEPQNRYICFSSECDKFVRLITCTVLQELVFANKCCGVYCPSTVWKFIVHFVSFRWCYLEYDSESEAKSLKALYWSLQHSVLLFFAF